MIKKLLEHDDDLIEETKPENAAQTANDLTSGESADLDAFVANKANSIQETPVVENVAPQISDDSQMFPDSLIESNADAESVKTEKLENETNDESPLKEINQQASSPETKIDDAPPNDTKETPLFQTITDSDSIGETARQSGLAYGAAITLFGSVVFMLILGWGADLLFGTSPWGIVGGIALGAIIGFFQFFRITSQIFKK